MRLDPSGQDWMREGAGPAVIAALEAARPGCARYVGGCVRNALMGVAVGDIDIATQLTPEQTTKALHDAGLKAAPTGIAHGTVTAVAGGVGVEVTTLRRDVSTDGRRAVVAFTEDWAEDSARRDFRFNAVYCAPDGELFDPQDGVADAKARQVVFIGDPGARIAEDALRILRFFRLHAQYGSGRPDRDGLLACARGKTLLDALSGERVWAEMKKLLSAEAPEQALRWMQTADILRAAIGPCDGLEAAVRLAVLRRERGWPRDAVLLLVALAGAGETRAERLAGRLKMSRAERAQVIRFARITCAKSDLEGPRNEKNSPLSQERLYREGAAFIADETRLCWARARADAAHEGGDIHARDAHYEAALESACVFTPPEFPLSGNDLQDAGFEQGKTIGDVLRALETRWIESKFTLTKSELLSLARTIDV